MSRYGMADRYPSFFGPILPQRPDAPEAFTPEELVQIRARRIEADVVRAAAPAWPERRRFETMVPAAPPMTLPKAAPPEEADPAANVRAS
ncbi:MAG TPA: hypothetical protein VGI39_41280 [Polyangiaceae bacterium]|jgi:hypothetical protein